RRAALLPAHCGPAAWPHRVRRAVARAYARAAARSLRLRGGGGAGAIGSLRHVEQQAEQRSRRRRAAGRLRLSAGIDTGFNPRRRYMKRWIAGAALFGATAAAIAQDLEQLNFGIISTESTQHLK